MPVRFPNQPDCCFVFLTLHDAAVRQLERVVTASVGISEYFWIMHAPMPFNTRNWYPYYWGSTFCPKCLGLFLDSGQKSWFRLHVQPECNHTIIIAWGFRRYIYIYIYIYIHVNKTESTYIWLKYKSSPVACCDHTAIWGWFSKSTHHHSSHVTVKSFECFQICIYRYRYRSRYILFYYMTLHFIILYHITSYHIISYSIIYFTMLYQIKVYCILLYIYICIYIYICNAISNCMILYCIMLHYTFTYRVVRVTQGPGISHLRIPVDLDAKDQFHLSATPDPNSPYAGSEWKWGRVELAL